MATQYKRPTDALRTSEGGKKEKNLKITIGRPTDALRPQGVKEKAESMLRPNVMPKKVTEKQVAPAGRIMRGKSQPANTGEKQSATAVDSRPTTPVSDAVRAAHEAAQQEVERVKNQPDIRNWTQEELDRSMELLRMGGTVEEMVARQQELEQMGVRQRNQKIGAAESQRDSLAAAYYEAENQEKKAAMSQDKTASDLYASLQALQKDRKQYQALMGTGSLAREAMQGELSRKYSVSAGGDLLSTMIQKEAEAKAALAEMGYDFDRMEEYQRTQEQKAKAEEKQRKTAEFALGGIRITEGALRDMQGFMADPEGYHPVIDETYFQENEGATKVASGIVSSAASVLASPLQGIDYLKKLGQGVGRSDQNDLDHYVPLNTYDMDVTNFVRTVRGTVAQEIEEAAGEFWGPVGSFGYQTGMSMADFLFNALLTGNFTGGLGGMGTEAAKKAASNLSLAIMGSGAASNTTLEAIERGLNNRQALTLGAVAGMAEVITEKVSLEALLDKTSMGKSLRGYILQNIISEGSEEVGSDIINLVADILISKDKSEWAQSVAAYEAQGLPPGQAFGMAVKDQAMNMGLDFLGGALSGGVMAGGSVAINNALTHGDAVQTGADMNAMGSDVVLAAIEEGLQSDKATDSYKRARALQRKLERGETITDKELGRLYQANVVAIDEENREAEALPRPGEEQKGPQFLPGTPTPEVAARFGLTQEANPQAFGGLETETKSGERAVEYLPRPGEESRASRYLSKPGEENFAREYVSEPGLVYDDTLRFSVDTAQFNRLNEVAKALGTRVRFVDSVQGGLANAQIVGNEILVERNNQNPVNFLLGHEWTHRIQSLAPEAYIQFRDRIAAELGSEASRIQQLYENKGLEITAEGALDEAAADYAGRLLEDGKLLDEFIERNRADKTFLEKVLDAIKSLIGRLTGSEKAQAETAAGKLSAALDAARTANENAALHQDGGERFALKGVREDGIEVYETSPEVLALTQKEKMNQFLTLMENEYAGRTARFTMDGDVLYAKFESDDIRKNIYGDGRSDRAGWKAKINTGADGGIFDLVENATHKGSGAEVGKPTAAHKGVTGWEYFVKTVQVDGQVFDLLANIRKKPEGEYVYSIQLRANKNYQAAPASFSADGLTVSKQGLPDNDIVSQNGGDVNGKFSLKEDDQTQSRQFKQWFGDWQNDPEHASKVVDEDGKPLVVYHGTDAEFTVFDRKKGRSTMDIQGSFFSPWKVDAAGYGPMVGAYYLALKNPASEQAAYAALRRFQGQNNAGEKAREYLISKGYDGVNNSGEEYIAFFPEQIKSATENVGTFDGKNPDIRYSLKEDADQKKQTKPIAESNDGVYEEDSWTGLMQQAETDRLPYGVQERMQRMTETENGEYQIPPDIQEKLAEREARKEQTVKGWPDAGKKENYRGTPATEKLGIRIEKSIAGLDAAQSLRGIEKAQYEAQRALNKILKESQADERTRTVAENIAEGKMPFEDAKRLGLNTELVKEIADAYCLVDSYDKNAIKKRQSRYNWEFDAAVQEMIQNSDSKKAPGVLSMNLNTMQRNNERVWGTDAKAINAELFDPIQVNEAERIRFVNRMLGQMEQFHLNKEESAAVQRLIEGKATEGELMAEGMDGKRLSQAAKTLSSLYNDLYQAINDFLVSHGYKEIGFQKNYAPHQQEENVGQLQKYLQRLGFAVEVTELPTEIAGRTEAFRPGKQYDPYFQHRTGTKTKYDAVGGFESYINYISNVFYHTDDIQKLRRFSEALRVKYSGDELGAQLDQLNNLEDGLWGNLQEEDIQAKKEALYNRYSRMTKFGGYVSVLDDYTNILAGKQAKVDRAIESMFGRRPLNIGRAIQNKFSQAAVLGNLSSAVNQTVQLPQLTAEVGSKYVAQAVLDVVTGETGKTGFNQESDFLTGKTGIQSITPKKGSEKVFNLAAKPFEVVDDFASRVIVRSKYLQLLGEGMEHSEALRVADEFATRLVGSRMKGAKPVFFEQKNFISKLVSTFQLEVANGWEHIVHDLPLEIRQIEQEKGRGAAIRRVAELAVASQICAFIANMLIKAITGREPVPFDGLGMIANYLATGYGMTKEEYLAQVADNATEGMGLGRYFGTESGREDFDLSGAIQELGEDALGDVPYVSNVTGMLGITDSRLPLPQIAGNKTRRALGQLGTAITTRDEEERNQALAQGLPGLGWGVLEDATTWLPMGNQIKKTAQGIDALIRGGSYSGYGGEEKLQYEVERTPLNIAKGVLFGKSALPEADQYYSTGTPMLSAKQTDVYQELVNSGINERVAYELIQKIRKAETSNEKRNIVRDSLLPDEEKKILYQVISDDKNEEIDFVTGNGLTFNDYLEAESKYTELNKTDMKAGEKATEFAFWLEKKGYTVEQEEALKETFRFFSHIPVEASGFEKMIEGGVSAESAYRLSEVFADLEPEQGKQGVSTLQKLQAIVNSGIEEYEAKSAVQCLLQDGQAEKFEAIMEAGMSVAQYVEYRGRTSGLEADRDSDGKAIPGSKKEKVLQVINEMDLSNHQKDVLYLAEGYAESELKNVHWGSAYKGAGRPTDALRTSGQSSGTGRPTDALRSSAGSGSQGETGRPTDALRNSGQSGMTGRPTDVLRGK